MILKILKISFGRFIIYYKQTRHKIVLFFKTHRFDIKAKIWYTYIKIIIYLCQKTNQF